MKVVMIGTPICANCKRIAPNVAAYCEEHNIEYTYMHLTNAPSDIVDILVAKKVTQAPAFIIYRGDEIVVITGDSIFVELEKIEN